MRTLSLLFIVGSIAGCSERAIAPSSPSTNARGKPVVITFDDSVKSHYTVAREVLKRYGFGATFFISEGFTFKTNKTDYMTWEEIRALSDDGFEIGNHTRDHKDFTKDSGLDLGEQLEGVNRDCEQAGIPRPVSFAWPSNQVFAASIPILEQHGIKLARRGVVPELGDKETIGFGFKPGFDHPLMIPTTGIALPAWTMHDLETAMAKAAPDEVPVLQLHGVPDGEHPFVSTPRDRFEAYMAWLHDHGYVGIAMRDLPKYVDMTHVPADPFDAVRARMRARAGDAGAK
jgi:peptidoglycan/xylan/chitin deacetylase (PgdA/CDA1 family)